MLYCFGSGHELLSASAVFAVCQDSKVFLVLLLAVSIIIAPVKSIVIESPRVFGNIRVYSTLFCISDMFFFPGAEGSFGFANITPRTRSARNFVNDITSVFFRGSKLWDREVLL